LFSSRLLGGESHLLDLGLGSLLSRHDGCDGSECLVDLIMEVLLVWFEV
jgi:hypothetical protein